LGPYVSELKEYIPAITKQDIQKGKRSGVRALAVNPDGKLEDDFVFNVSEKWKSVLHVRNAPSPAATASLAIAEEIANKAETNFFNK
jgi:L-2-hydroxyglutarate oxidase LhgO